MHNHFKVVSLSYKNAPVAIREMVSFDEILSKKLLGALEKIEYISEALVVSTCNRTEVYYASPTDFSAQIIDLIAKQKAVNRAENIDQYFLSITDHDMSVQHLFHVAIGLEAQVVGDLQIINQIKHAYQWAADLNMTGSFLHRLLHTIFYTNKRVVQETSFRDGAASVSYATVELVQEFIFGIETPKILVLGLGEIGEDVARNLIYISQKEVWICNRSLEKATSLAEELDYQVVPFEQYKQAILDADIIISSISTSSPLITKYLFNKVLSHKYFFDLSIPRSIAPDIESVSGLLLYNIDGIQNKATEALERRIASIPDVKFIINEAIEEFGNWAKEMEVSPVINKLKNALEEIRQTEMSRYYKKVNLKEANLIDKVTKNMMQKVIKLPVLQLKAACKRGEADSLIEVLNDVFNLEKQSENILK